MSDKKKIIASFLRIDLPPGNLDFRLALVQIVVSRLGKSLIDAEAFADAGLRRYWNWLQVEMDGHLRRGISPFFVLPSSTSYAFACASLELQGSSVVDDRKLGVSAKSRANILRQIDALTDREFEALACVTCRAIGATNIYLTPPGNEGGIDFFATLSIKTDTHVFSARGSELRIVGQCKKFDEPVSVNRVDEFLKTIENVRHRSPRVKDHIPTWFDAAKGPIIGWMISHRGFQSGSSDEAKQHGVVLSDSLDLAHSLSLSDMIAPTEPGDVRAALVLSECRGML